MTRLYHFLVLQFGGPQGVIIAFGILAILLLCGLFGLVCYFHLKMQDKHSRRSKVHQAPVIKPALVQQRKSPPVKERITSDSYRRLKLGAESNGTDRAQPQLSLVASNEGKAKHKNAPELKTVGEKHQFVDSQIVSGHALVNEITRRINSIELLLGDRIYLANQNINSDLIQSRRILQAIYLRLQDLVALLKNPTDQNIETAYSIAAADLVIPKDSVNDLLDAKPIKPIAPSEWADVLDQFLTDAERYVATAINQ